MPCHVGSSLDTNFMSNLKGRFCSCILQLENFHTYCSTKGDITSRSVYVRPKAAASSN